MITHYYQLEPEVAGGLGEQTELDRRTHPPTLAKLHYEFDGWLGDDLLCSFPAYIVTERLRRALEEMRPSGCRFDSVTITKSDLFEELHPNRRLPTFWWLKVMGRAGMDDIGMPSSDPLRVVVSQRTLDCLRRFSVDHCGVTEYPQDRRA